MQMGYMHTVIRERTERELRLEYALDARLVAHGLDIRRDERHGDAHEDAHGGDVQREDDGVPTG